MWSDVSWEKLLRRRQRLRRLARILALATLLQLAGTRTAARERAVLEFVDGEAEVLQDALAYLRGALCLLALEGPCGSLGPAERIDAYNAIVSAEFQLARRLLLLEPEGQRLPAVTPAPAAAVPAPRDAYPALPAPPQPCG